MGDVSPQGKAVSCHRSPKLGWSRARSVRMANFPHGQGSTAKTAARSEIEPYLSWPKFHTIGFGRRQGWFLRATEGLIYLDKSRFGVRVLLKNRLLPLKTA